jgi:thymidine phosphorylase
VLDVKVGRGAFMKDLPRARELAETLVGIGRRAGVRVWALLTAMDQPLGLAIGNALETIEAIDVLRGGGPPDLVEVTMALASRMLVLGGAADGLEDAEAKLRGLIASGRALDSFRVMVEQQGGDPRVADDAGVFPAAPVVVAAAAPRGGWVASIDAEALGLAGMALGAGRARAEDEVDPAVGIVLRHKVGARVAEGEHLAEVHARTAADAALGVGRVVAAFAFGDAAPERPRLVLDEIRPDDERKKEE